MRTARLRDTCYQLTFIYNGNNKRTAALKKIHFTEFNRYEEGSGWRMSVQLNGVSYAEVGKPLSNLFLKTITKRAVTTEVESLF